MTWCSIHCPNAEIAAFESCFQSVKFVEWSGKRQCVPWFVLIVLCGPLQYISYCLESLAPTILHQPLTFTILGHQFTRRFKSVFGYVQSYSNIKMVNNLTLSRQRPINWSSFLQMLNLAITSVDSQTLKTVLGNA